MSQSNSDRTLGKIATMEMIDRLSTQGKAYYEESNRQAQIDAELPAYLNEIELRRLEAVRAANEQAGDDCRAAINKLVEPVHLNKALGTGTPPGLDPGLDYGSGEIKAPERVGEPILGDNNTAATNG